MGAGLALLSTTALSGPAYGQLEQREEFAFDFDQFSARLKAMAAAPYEKPVFDLPASFTGLDYDAYRLIQFRGDKAKWAADDLGYQVHGFHLGWLFGEPVRIYEIEGGLARPMQFSADDFAYYDAAVEKAAHAQAFPGVAGFRLNYPLNKPEAWDELISFLGASYFRALGRDNVYGLSARGVVLNSWVEGAEEFPRFSEFYLQKPQGDEPLVVYAALEGPSIAGAYRFVLTPGSATVQPTVMDVTARLFFRNDVRELGIAPLTSMFLYAEANRAGFDDYRPQVHDSNGLLIERENGEVLWRALDNTEALGNSYLWENNPRAFGLYQRGRDFETYQDAGAHYERRPSVRIEPNGNWGEGTIRLIEIPSKLEVDDNIVSFWIPSQPILAGSEHEFSYRLIWGDLDPPPDAAIAFVAETRAGQGGVSGVANAVGLRKFVVDFQGGELAGMPEDARLDILATVSSGVVRHSTLSKVAANGVWRLVLDIEADGLEPMEIKAYVVGGGRKLTETWLYQWRPNHEV
ncbi:MAG: glucan biosynthesis protein [Devosia sp.]|nr:glucan biosynthesis protein [Devosia sp.]